MTTTTLKLTINHNTKLPDGLTDVVADRAYQYIHAKGGHAGDVTAEIVDDVGDKHITEVMWNESRTQILSVTIRDAGDNIVQIWSAVEIPTDADMLKLPVVSLPEVKEQHARLLRKAGV